MADRVGEIKQREIDLLELTHLKGTPIFIGPQNISHMQSEHLEAYVKYGEYLTKIIDTPKYVSLHPSDGSIQYIKEFYEGESQDRVLVAVRTSRNGKLFARTLFVMSETKWAHYTEKGYIKEY